MTTFPSVGERNSNFPTRRKIVCKDYCCRSLGRGRIPFQSRLFEGRDGARSQCTKGKNGLSFRSVARSPHARSFENCPAHHGGGEGEGERKESPLPPPVSFPRCTQSRHQQEGGGEKGKGKRPFSCCTAQGSEGGLHISCLLFPFHPARRRGSYLNCPTREGRRKREEICASPSWPPCHVCTRPEYAAQELQSSATPSPHLFVSFPLSLLAFFICGEGDRSGRGKCCSCCCCCCWEIWGDCFPISHVHSKWVYQQKTFLQNGCIQRKLFFKMGASRENFCCKIDASKIFFTSKWVHQVPFFYRIFKKELFCLF